MKRKTIRRIHRIAKNVLTAISIFVICVSGYFVAASEGGWIPVIYAWIAFAYLAAVAYFDYMKECKNDVHR